MKKLWTSLALLAAFALAGTNAFALKVLPGEDGKRHQVDIPANELTRIGIDGQKMKGFKYKVEELEVNEDKEAGAIYVMPLPAAKEKKISVFVISASGQTHEVVLNPVASLPLESIVIREQQNRAIKRAGGPNSVDKANSLEVAVKRLVLAMAKEDETQPDIQVDKVNIPMVLWKEAQFVQVGKYSSRSLIGDAFKLMNTSGKPMRVAEQELFKPGVVAVVVESQILRSGEETNVYVIRQVNGNE